MGLTEPAAPAAAVGVSLEGRRFATPGTATPVGDYHESADVVWAEYAGGDVVAGRIVGRRAPDGTLHLAYGHLCRDGVVVSGRCTSLPTLLPDGRVRIEERWRRHDGSEGVSVIEELRDAQRPAREA
jgi:hypothetical protein